MRSASEAAYHLVMVAPLEQKRLVRTAIPGPRSTELHARRLQQVPTGFGITLPVFVDRADGGIIVDGDGNQIIDLASGIAVTSVGASAPAVVFDHAYHGRTLMTMTMTAKQHGYKQGFGPFAPEVYRVPTAYPYRWPGGPDKAADEAFARFTDVVLHQVGAENVAAVVAEPVLGEGGFIVPAPGFLPKVAEFCAAHGIVFVADEVQAGIARTGAWFASEHEGIVPDLVCSAKALGGGLPIAAVTGRAEIMNAAPAGGLGGTYAGNPIACAAALGALETIEAEGLVDRARQIGEHVLPQLKDLAAAHPSIGDVRGRGAMLAVELVRPGTDEPAPEITAAIARHCHANGVLVLTCGTYGNVIRLLPPLVIRFDLLDDALAVLGEAITAAEAAAGAA